MRLMMNILMKNLNKKTLLYIIPVILCFIKLPEGLLSTVIYATIIVPLAIMLGGLTSDISEYIGEKKGGLLAAGVGNIPEITMGIWAINYGMISMVKSALIGSIISNMLLVLGISIFFGGVKYKEQSFNKIVARTNFTMLILAMATMIVMASLNNYSSIVTEEILINLSVKIGIVLIVVYILGLIFSLYTHSNLFIGSDLESDSSLIKSKGFLKILLEIIVVAVILYFVSEKLIFNLSITVNQYNISQEFLGIILIPLLGNSGENFSAIMCAMKNKINLSLEIAIGSSIQISLFVTPLLIIFSFIMGVKMTLLFSGFQIIISVVAVLMSLLVFQDGKTYWFEGAVLIAIYMVVTLAYYYLV